MKLNLLPTYVSKGNQAKTATVVSVLLALIGIGGALAMIFISKGQLNQERDNAQTKLDAAAQAVAYSKQADKVMSDAVMIVRNIGLADAMLKHSDVYPDLYHYLKPYIPGFFGLRTISAAPNDAATATVTMTGTVKTFQQYADLMIALYRIPGATSVSRGGFVNGDPYIPNVTEADQNARPIKPGQTNIPDDKLERLRYFQGLGTLTGFTGEGGFGTVNRDQPRGAMPGYSLVTVQVVIPRELLTPDPRATLQQQTRSATGTPATGGPAGGPGLGGPGGPGFGAGPGGGAPPAPSGAGAGRGGAGGKNGAEDTAD